MSTKYPNVNKSVTTLTAAGLGTTNSSDLDGSRGKGVIVTIDITVITGTGPSLTVTIQGKDQVSGKYYTILASAALAAVATTILKVYPGLTAAANLVVNDIMPPDFRISSVVAGTGPAVTATISAAVIE